MSLEKSMVKLSMDAAKDCEIFRSRFLEANNHDCHNVSLHNLPLSVYNMAYAAKVIIRYVI